MSAELFVVLLKVKKKEFFYKAGEKRLLGIRPKVRGIARNPVDHPNGGRTNGGKIFKDRWGNKSKGFKTAKFKNKNYLIYGKANIGS